MNTIQIYDLLKKRCGGSFLGVLAIDRLPARLPSRRPVFLICNTDLHDTPGEHWIAMYFDREGEFFDSFGRAPDGIFKSFMDKRCSSWTYNETRLQSVISQFCGHYCVFYCLFKHLDYSMESIVNCFTSDTALNDVMAHSFVCWNL